MSFVNQFLLEMDEQDLNCTDILSENGARGLLNMYHQWLERNGIFDMSTCVDEPPPVHEEDAYETV